MKKLLVVLFLFVAIPVTAGEKAPLPKRLTSARTAFIINEGVWFKTYDKFYAELVKWNRFELVQSKEQADIVIVLSTTAINTGAVITSTQVTTTGTTTAINTGSIITGTQATNTGATTVQVPIIANKFYIWVIDSTDGTLLWSDSKGTSFWLVSNSAKGLVSNLRKRFKGIGYTPPIEKTKRKATPAYTTPQVSREQGDGNKLLEQCTQAIRFMTDAESLNDLQGMDAMFCLGFIGGVLDTHTLVVAITESQPIYCIPKGGIKRGQGARILVKWLKDNPEKLHLNHALLSFMALKEAFPCKKKEAPSP